MGVPAEDDCRVIGFEFTSMNNNLGSAVIDKLMNWSPKPKAFWPAPLEILLVHPS